MGKPMIVRTYLQAKKSKSLDRLVVATDDERIAKACKEAGAEVVMTSSECANGQPSLLICHACRRPVHQGLMPLGHTHIEPDQFQ